MAGADVPTPIRYRNWGATLLNLALVILILPLAGLLLAGAVTRDADNIENALIGYSILAVALGTTVWLVCRTLRGGFWVTPQQLIVRGPLRTASFGWGEVEAFSRYLEVRGGCFIAATVRGRRRISACLQPMDSRDAWTASVLSELEAYRQLYSPPGSSASPR